MEKNEHFTAVLWWSIIFSVISSVLILGVSFFRWTLMDVVTPLFEPILELVIWGSAIIMMIVSLIFSLVYMVNARRLKVLVAIPLFICVAVVMGAYSIPFTKLYVRYDFKSNFKERTLIVEKIKLGQLNTTPTFSDNQSSVMLPLDSVHLSKGGGEVLFENNGSTTSVFFYTFKGILDNFSGFIYRSDDNEPSPTDFHGNYIEINKLSDHWFWAASR